MSLETFNPLSVSSKFAICGLPIRVDTYKTCSFGCKYCFANYRKVMHTADELQVANLMSLKNKLIKVYDKKQINPNNFLDFLLTENITWHCGGMSDPFQHAEKELKITSKMLEITNDFDISILFSTKTDTTYDYTHLESDLHSFQLSVTSATTNTELEPNVPALEKRIQFFQELKDKGFAVGIRIQPFIPSVSNANIVDLFKEADYFSIEGLKLVPQNKEQKQFLLNTLNLKSTDFIQRGLLNLCPELRWTLYQDLIERLQHYNIPYSLADNDLHHISSSKCCCGEPLIKKSTEFNNTALFKKYGKYYTIDEVNKAIGACKKCKVASLFASNRQEEGVTVQDFFNLRFSRKSSPFSPKFMFYPQPKLNLFN